MSSLEITILVMVYALGIFTGVGAVWFCVYITKLSMDKEDERRDSL